MKTQHLGARGETLAREFLEQHGYEFVQANFTRRIGEIDLIMLAPRSDSEAGSDQQQTIVFVEVRYRSSSDFGGAIASIDWRKQRKMVRAAQAWLQRNASSTDCARIDVIALQPNGGIPGGPDLHSWQNHDLLWLQNAVEQLT